MWDTEEILTTGYAMTGHLLNKMFAVKWQEFFDNCCEPSVGLVIWLPGVASKLALSVPGSAGTAGLEPSMDLVSMELVLEIPDFFFFCRAFWIDAVSDGRLASWWKTFRFRMIVYTRLQLPDGRFFVSWGWFYMSVKLWDLMIWLEFISLFSPSNWYWMMLLKTSSMKKTRWWFWAEEKRNQGVENASSRWSSLLAATMERLFRYGETVNKKSRCHKRNLTIPEVFKHSAILVLIHQGAAFHWWYSLFTMIVSRQSKRGWRRWCPLVMILWKILTWKSKVNIHNDAEMLQVQSDDTTEDKTKISQHQNFTQTVRFFLEKI